MTREEIIRNLKYTMKKHKNDIVSTFGTNISVMCKDILEYLEQEPKTGHWLYIDERKAKCSQCRYVQITGGADKTGHCNIHYGVYKYCTNCGAKMVKSQESEEL